jgi:hypothetical protein
MSPIPQETAQRAAWGPLRRRVIIWFQARPGPGDWKVTIHQHRSRAGGAQKRRWMPKKLDNERGRYTVAEGVLHAEGIATEIGATTARTMRKAATRLPRCSHGGGDSPARAPDRRILRISSRVRRRGGLVSQSTTDSTKASLLAGPDSCTTVEGRSLRASPGRPVRPPRLSGGCQRRWAPCRWGTARRRCCRRR